jgi:hypothetical protein
MKHTALCLTLSFVGSISAADSAGRPSLALTGGRIYRAPDQALIADGAILIRGDRIVEVGPRGSIES